jgi:hypothetical protein
MNRKFKMAPPVLRLAFFAALLLAAGRVFGLDGFFVGIGAEASGYTREGAAYGGGLSFGIDLNGYNAAGVKAMYGSDFDTVTALEAAAFFRWYPLAPRGLFAQFELGTGFIFEEGRTAPAFLGALALGWRFELPRNVYIEMSARGGHPFAWGAGLAADIAFPSKRLK